MKRDPVDKAASNLAVSDPADDRFIPDVKVAKRYDVHLKTLSRWDAKPELGFPPPVIIGERKHRQLSALIEWERKQIAKAAAAQS